MPGYLQTGFDVSLNSCTAASYAASPSGQLVAPNGQCLAVNENNVIVAVDCTDVAMQTQMTWSFNAFLYWACVPPPFLLFLHLTLCLLQNGPQNAACPSGLYGYTVRDNSGYPAQVQTAPMVVGCQSASGVFPFSLLM